MKLKGAKKVHYDSGPNMTPLVDVVMVILIFLMLAGSFGTAEHFMVSAVPIHAKGAGGVPPPPGWTPPILLDVQISQNGDALVPGFKTREPDPEAVEKQLETKMAEFKAQGHSAKDVEVVLHPMAGTKWENLAPLYAAALDAKFEKVSFAQTQ
jgi:biopolymer transport protein ExbD